MLGFAASSRTALALAIAVLCSCVDDPGDEPADDTGAEVDSADASESTAAMSTSTSTSTSSESTSSMPSTGEDTEVATADTGAGDAIITVSLGSYAGANAIAGEQMQLSPEISDPWLMLDDLTPETFDAMASDGDNATAHFEFARDGRSITVRGDVTGSSPGNGALGGLATATFTDLSVCIEEPAATSFRFVVDCTGTVDQSGNSGVGQIQLNRELAIMCNTMASMPIDFPWEHPDGTTYDIESVSGSACATFDGVFTAGAGHNGIDDNSGTASAEGEITITVESIY